MTCGVELVHADLPRPIRVHLDEPLPKSCLVGHRCALGTLRGPTLELLGRIRAGRGGGGRSSIAIRPRLRVTMRVRLVAGAGRGRVVHWAGRGGRWIRKSARRASASRVFTLCGTHGRCSRVIHQRSRRAQRRKNVALCDEQRLCADVLRIISMTSGDIRGQVPSALRRPIGSGARAQPWYLRRGRASQWVSRSCHVAWSMQGVG